MSALTTISQSTVSGVDTPSGQPETLPPEKLPKTSEAALEFLESIGENDFTNILFDDSLVTVSDTGKELGEFTVTVSPTRHQGQDCFLVHANSHGAVDDVPCGTSIRAFVNKALETLEQEHHEYVKLTNNALDRKTIVVREEGEFVVNRVITQGEKVERSVQTYNLKDIQGFVSEGSNLLLQRLMVKKGLPDNFQMISFDSDTNLCPVQYCALERRTAVIEGQELDVVGVERTIKSLTDIPVTWHSYFTKLGYLTGRVQVGSPVTMRLLVMPPTTEEVEVMEKPVFEKKELSWEEDPQLYSQYLDKKAELVADHKLYMRNHPEMKALLADFLQFLLLRKPDDIVEFAADYFSSFSSQMGSTPAYSQSSAPTPHPQSRSNSKILFLTKSKLTGM